MEAALAVSSTPEQKTEKPQSFGLGKTNMNHLTHHIGQAIVSLGRVGERGDLMVDGKTGTYAVKLRNEIDRLSDISSDLHDISVSIEVLRDEIEELTR